jgi:hypothetical protein
MGIVEFHPLTSEETRYYDTMDERVGRFTRIQHLQDRVVIRETGARRRGRILGLVIITAVGLTFALALFRAGQSIGGAIVSFAALLFLCGMSRKLLRDGRRIDALPHLVVFDDDAETDEHSSAALTARDIEAVEVRENCGRDVSDMAMWQTYLHLRSTSRAALIHQRPKWRRAREIALAKELAQRWGVPLIAGR